MKNIKLWIGICVLLLAAGIAGSILISAPHEGSVVEIMRDGAILYQYDMERTEFQTLEIEYNGHINTVQIDENGIRVLNADCPDQTCVNMGYLKVNGLPIVCLPNHLVIQYGSENSELDAVAR